MFVILIVCRHQGLSNTEEMRDFTDQSRKQKAIHISNVLTLPPFPIRN